MTRAGFTAGVSMGMGSGRIETGASCKHALSGEAVCDERASDGRMSASSMSSEVTLTSQHAESVSNLACASREAALWRTLNEIGITPTGPRRKGKGRGEVGGGGEDGGGEGGGGEGGGGDGGEGEVDAHADKGGASGSGTPLKGSDAQR